MKKIVSITATVLLGIAALTACNDSDGPVPAPSPQADGGSFTQGIVDETWEGTNSSDREDICLGVELFTHDEIAQLMQEGAGDDAALVDWDLAAELLSKKCG